MNEISTINKRNFSVDNLKGLLIVLVVLGHTYNSFFKDFIYLFHVGVFFILSGYCFNQRYTDNLIGLKELFIKRIKSLWIPYVSYNFIFLLLQNLLIKIGFLTTDVAYFDFDPMLPDGFCMSLTLKTGIIAFIKSLFFINSRPFAGGLWFLGGVFYVTIGYAIIQLFLKKLKIEKYHIFISVIFLVFGWLMIKSEFFAEIPMAKQICIILITEILFALGTYIKEYVVFPKLSKWYYLVGLIYFAALTYFLSLYGAISIAGVHIVNPLFYITSILTGGGMAYCFVQLVPRFSYIGKRTIPILALHLLSFKIISLIQWKIYDGDFIVLSLYPVWTIKPEILWSFLCLFVGVGFPLLINFMLSKTKIGKFCFKCL